MNKTYVMILCSFLFLSAASTQSEPVGSFVTMQPKMGSEQIFLLNDRTIITATVVCALAVVVIYKREWFFYKDAQRMTEQDVQKMIETVIHNDVISKNDTLNKIFDILVSNGLTNIVVYNEHLFEIDDQFKVELCEDSVKVTRLA